MFKDKKGLEKSIVVAIAILVTAVILFIAYKLIFDTGTNMVDRETCRNSVLLKERSKLLGQPLIKDLNCETHLVDVNSRDETEIKRIIVDEMYDCWYQFGAGERDFLNDYDPWKGDNYCFVCSRLNFDKGTQNEVGQINGLFNYLSTEPLPLHNQQTFFDYIYGDFSNELKQQNFESSYVTSEPLYVVFFADKRFELWAGTFTELTRLGSVMGVSATAGSALGGPVGGAIGAAGGAIFVKATTKTKYLSGLYVGNDEKIIEWCQQ